MLGQRPADAYRAYRSRSSGSRQTPPPRKRRGRVAEVAIIGLMVLAGLFVVVVGFWAVTLDGGREAEPEVQPTPTLGERPENWLRVLVQNEAGEPFAAALVEFRDRLDQVVATQLTDQDGRAEALVTVGADYSVAVRIRGYEVTRLPDLVVAQQDTPRHTVTVQRAQGAASAAPPAATAAPAAGSEAATPAPTASAAPTVSSEARTAPIASTPTSSAANTTAAAPTAVPAPAPQLIVAHPNARFTTIDPASNLALSISEPLGWQQFPLLAQAQSPGRLWVGPRGSNLVIAFDLTEMAAADEIDLGKNVIITAMAEPPAGQRLWVGGVQADEDNQYTGRVFEVSTAADSFGEVLRRMNVPRTVSTMMTRADGEMLYLLHRRTGRVMFFQPQDGQTALEVTIPENTPSQSPDPTQQTVSRFIRSTFMFALDQRELFFVNRTQERIVAISAETGEPTRVFEVGPGVAAIRVHPDGKHLYVANRTLGMIQLVDLETAQVADAIPVGQAPRALAFSADGARAYVANQGSDTVSVIDVAERRVSDTIALEYTPINLIYAP